MTTQIDLHNGNNGNTDVSGGDTVVFHNAFNNKSVTLTLPEKQGGGSPFKGNPPTQITLSAGENSGDYEVKNNASGDFDYSWEYATTEAATRTGRIVVD